MRVRALSAPFCVAAALMFGTACTSRETAVRASQPLSPEQLLSVSSVLAGTDAPAWRPDGAAITYLASYGGPPGVWSIGPKGGQRELLVDTVVLSGVGSLATQHPIWSPNGDYVAYVSSKGGAPEIWLWSPRDRRSIRLTNLGGRVNSMNWSPDGAHIAFAGDRYGSEDIYTVAVPGGDVVRLTSDPRYEVFPTWTPDGRTIVFDRLDDRWQDHDVMAIPADGSDLSAKNVFVRATQLFSSALEAWIFACRLTSPDKRFCWRATSVSESGASR